MSASRPPSKTSRTGCCVPAFRDVPHGIYARGKLRYLVATYAPREGLPLPIWARDAVGKGRFSAEEVRLIVSVVTDGKGRFGRQLTVRPPRVLPDWLDWALGTPIQDRPLPGVPQRDPKANPYTGQVAVTALGGFLPRMHAGRALGIQATPECAAAHAGCSPAEAHALIRAASADLVDALFPEEIRALAENLASGGTYPGGMLSEWHIPGPGSVTFGQAVAGWPCLAQLLLKQREGALGTQPPAVELAEGHPITGPVEGLLTPFLGPLAKPAHLRHLSGTRHRLSSPGAGFLGGLPPEWISAGRDEDGGRALGTVANALGKFASEHGIRAHDLVRESKGRWGAYATRLRRAAFPGVEGTSVTAVARHVTDMVDDFRRSVLTPCVDRHLAFDGTGSHESRLARDALVNSAEARARVLRLMLDAGGLSNLAERSGRYTGLADTIRMRLRATSPHVLSVLRWEPVLPPWSDPATGLDLVPLTDADELFAEGRRTPSGVPGAGLSHCVGGYGPRCAAGSSRIVSLRRTVPGGFERVSTLEVSWPDDGGPPVVAQHHGRGNREPPEAALRSVGRYLELVSDRPAPERLPVERGSWDRILAERCGYDPKIPANVALALELWRPMLPRRLRGLDPEGMARHLMGMTSPASLPCS